MIRRTTTLLSIIGMLAAGAVSAAEKSDDPHAGHMMDHAAMGHGTAAPADGPWSYKGRNSPAPYRSGRWEMVPVPGYGHMFIGTQGVSRELACAALDNPGVMVDRATRKACGLPERSAPRGAAPEPVKPAAAMEHPHH